MLLMGKLTISMAIFNSFLLVYQRVIVLVYHVVKSSTIVHSFQPYVQDGPDELSLQIIYTVYRYSGPLNMCMYCSIFIHVHIYIHTYIHTCTHTHITYVCCHRFGWRKMISQWIEARKHPIQVGFPVPRQLEPALVELLSLALKDLESKGVEVVRKM